MRHVAAGASTLALIACLAGAAPSLAQDVEAGKVIFQQQCALCHTAETGDGGGAQGPALGGVVGRAAASNPDFSYTPALKSSGLTWDAATLDHFLAAPTQAVPGSAMVIPVPNDEDRADLVAYLATATEPVVMQASAATSAVDEEDWRDDAPGRLHQIDVDNLPEPFATESANNFPRVVPRPEGAELHVPDGFKVETFATGLTGPRRMIETPDGDVLVAEANPGNLKLLHLSEDGASVESISTFATGLTYPFGLAFYPNAQDPEWLYVGEGDKVVRFPYHAGDMEASGEPDVVVPSLPAGGHPSRDLVFSQDGSKFYVAVGSATNVGESMPEKTPEEAAAWDAENGLGAPWGPEEHRAMVLEFDTNGDGTPTIYATGIRNCVRLTRRPNSDDLWCTVNERDMLGDNLVPDYSTHVEKGAWYGWPWYYFGDHEDPRREGERPDLAGKATVPDVPYTAHSAAVGFAFYEPSTGSSAFPATYEGDAFAVFHGSWNRGPRTGHKVVHVLFENGEPTGAYEDFLTGFIVDDSSAWGRPSSLAVLDDGSLLLSDDGTGVIYRVAYEGQRGVFARLGAWLRGLFGGE
jgi:glucose/arabinose dehydrogenase/cytochrome c2